MRTCIRCGVAKEDDNFGDRRNVCKPCRLQQKRGYYKAHKAEYSEKHKVYYQKHKTELKQYKEKRRAEHHTHILEQEGLLRIKHRDAIIRYTQTHRKQKNAYSASHKEQARDRNLKQTYGIHSRDYNKMLAEQGGRCAICGTENPGSRYEVFFVDHDHITGKVRGLLCAKCNYLLGYAKDSPDVLLAAVDYLYKDVVMLKREA
jgi:hypothetical protein